MTASSKAQTFTAAQKREHMIIIASGERIRHMKLRPWAAVLAGTLAFSLVMGYFAATAYLVLRDDLIGAAAARQARIQHGYEDRIAALRAQVDRVTSRQILDQRLMERQIAQLAADQAALDSRHGKLDALFDPTSAGLSVPIPTKRPDLIDEQGEDLAGNASGKAALDAIAMITGSGEDIGADGKAHPARSGAMLSYAPSGTDTTPDVDGIDLEADRPTNDDGASLAAPATLQSIALRQMRQVTSLADNAFETAERIEGALRDAGLAIPENDAGDGGTGGPFIEAGSKAEPSAFAAKLDDLDAALLRLDTVRQHAARMPLGHPAIGKTITSRFGKRRDPFLGRTAFHSGVDFDLDSGDPVRSSGSGTVITASRQGGYGKMVEIDHGEGLVTRYAHLSSIAVTEGEVVAHGDVIGKAGSTGRSTGSHLHYEVRRNDRPLDPLRLIKAGQTISPVFERRG